MSLSEIQWADLVLQDIPAPVDATNEQNLINWMHAEEPAAQWWGGYGTASDPTRLNPLNTGVGTGGGSGLGSAPTLTAAAYDTASTIDQSNMAGIKSALEQSAPAATFGEAVIASPWAHSHYGNDITKFTGNAQPGPDVTNPAAIGTAQAAVAGTQAITTGDPVTGAANDIAGGASAVAGAIDGGANSGVSAVTGIGSGIVSDIEQGGAYLLILGAGVALVVAGIYKTANPGRTITQTATGTASTAATAAALA